MEGIHGAGRCRDMVGRKSGFTLIELLVVIAIIAILAAILFPVFVRAKRSATIRTCACNQKQLVTAMLSYLDDYNGKFPWAGCNGVWLHNTFTKPLGIGGSRTCWDALKKYVKNDKVRWCPMMGSSAYGQGKSWATIAAQYSWSYWYFCPHSGTDPVGNGWVARYPACVLCGYAMSDVSAPSKKPCFGEYNDLHDAQRAAHTTYYTMNMAFCDGHVKSYSAPHDVLLQTLYAGRDGTPAVVIP